METLLGGLLIPCQKKKTAPNYLTLWYRGHERGIWKNCEVRHNNCPRFFVISARMNLVTPFFISLYQRTHAKDQILKIKAKSAGHFFAVNSSRDPLIKPRTASAPRPCVGPPLILWQSPVHMSPISRRCHEDLRIDL